MSVDLALLILRPVVGGLVFGHGAQKLFGWFGGPGLRGTAMWLGSVGFRPAGLWALLSGLGEAGGGLLLALGLLSPLGALGVVGSMLMAIAKVHWGKGLWVSNGGSELPLTYGVVAVVLGLVGPGGYSLDAALGIALPSQLLFWVGLAAVLVVDAIGLAMSRTEPAAQPTQAA